MLNPVIGDQDQRAGVVLVAVTMHKQDGVHLHADGLLPRSAFVFDGAAVHQSVGRPLQRHALGLGASVQRQVARLRMFALFGQHEHVVLAEEQRIPLVLVQRFDVFPGQGGDGSGLLHGEVGRGVAQAASRGKQHVVVMRAGSCGCGGR